MTSRNLDKIITQSVRKSLIKEGLYPTDNDGNIISKKKNPYNYWNILTEFVNNLNYRMNITWKAKKGNISNQDVNDILEYLDISMDNLHDIFKLYQK